jgi:hypothetical protein
MKILKYGAQQQITKSVLSTKRPVCVFYYCARVVPSQDMRKKLLIKHIDQVVKRHRGRAAQQIKVST